MSAFRFPPPPPPPPKTTSVAESGPHPPSGARGRGRGRGRGTGSVSSRFRGGGRGRDGGGSDISQQPSSNPHTFSKNTAISQGYSETNDVTSGYNSNVQPNFDLHQSLPAGSYVNPSFRENSQIYNQSSRISAMASDSRSNGARQYGDRSPSHETMSSRDNAAGHKRKLEALRDPKPSRKVSGPPTAPSVPSFGAPVVPEKPVTTTNPGQNMRKMRTVNVLGLTPQNDVSQYSSSESENDDGADEEAMFAELGSNLTFEHNGIVMSLNSAAELASWKKERAKNFPTKARMAAKLEEKQQIGVERRRLLCEATEALQSRRHDRTVTRKQSIHKVEVELPLQESLSTRADSQSNDTITKRENVELVQQPAFHGQNEPSHVSRQEILSPDRRTAQAQVAADTTPLSASSSRNGHQAPMGSTVQWKQDDTHQALTESNDSRKDPAGEECVDTNNAGAHSVESSTSSESSSDTSSDAESEDDRPEEASSKQPAATFESSKTPCKFFTASGYCRDGTACRYKHELSAYGASPKGKDHDWKRNQQRHTISKESQLDALASSGRKSIHDRLLEQEQNEEAKLALEVVKYLGKSGVFAAKDNFTVLEMN